MVGGAPAPGSPDPVLAKVTAAMPPLGPEATPQAGATKLSPAIAPVRIEPLSELTEEWGRAWSGKNLNAYLGFYAPDFVGSTARSHAESMEARRRTIQRSQGIQVSIKAMQVRRLSPNRAEVSFPADLPGPGHRAGNKQDAHLGT